MDFCARLFLAWHVMKSSFWSNFTNRHLSADAMLKVIVDFEVLCAADVKILTLNSTFSQAVFYCGFGQNGTALNTAACEPFCRFV